MKQLRSHIELLSQPEIEMIYAKTLLLLERTGLKVPNDEILDICHSLGCVVDKATQTLYIPAALIEDMIHKNQAPRDKEDFTPRKLTGEISTQVFLVDLLTKEKRYGLMDDILKGIVLVEKLPFIREANSVVIPADIPSEMAEVEAFKMIYTYSNKPGGTYVLTPFSARYILPMADQMGLKHTYLFDTISPLTFRKETLEIALIYAKHGHPLRCGPLPMAGATAPVSAAGTILLTNAEVLGSMFLIQALTNSLCPFDALAHSVDMRTMLCSFGAPNQALFGMAMAQMARYYGFTTLTNTGLSDAILPDFQSGFEKGATAIMAHLTGSNNIGCQGIVGADQGFSFEQLVIDNEWLSYYNFILKGIEVTEESLGLDVIERVGFGGNYLAEEHTINYMHDNYWNSKLFKKDTWEQWTAGGQKDILSNAHDIVEKVTSDYRSAAPAIDKSKQEALNDIAAEAWKEYETS
ncbi:trimethylamine--corrinoid protein Co-methyltransferase [Parabacteroides sp. PF5-5]|nr:MULTISPECIES: trimethylamine methyltransferase family protein [unclassified Parabacteroides]MDH6316149.1 trimethylamine--corrinoid protein Co-methyltransferase [Parabacteroides sp. PF5-13]MDH6327340.1 trimethylamine--corrinoid protein Co-methyltransferase [Parabacteroides sp. PH5-41]MDH6335142.1 trimethylamine--corrinoid protein Co-methyltransferase [Parabacteroides sp. PF5-5]MDH6361162.1 trimethylamine--corrinoid protein Co-methyltransferase [Parabacteroides sp. PH5-16]MDH6376866.1 trimeth